MPSGDTTRPKPRARILDAARDLFRKHGIRGVGVDAIAGAANSNKMTLYRHFGSKDDLVIACLKAASHEWDDSWEGIEARHPGNAAAQLEDWIDRVAEGIRSVGDSNCEILSAAFQLAPEDCSALKVINEFKTRQRDRLARICRDAGIGDYELVATTLVLLAEGARSNRQSMGPEGLSTEFATIAHATVGLFMPMRPAGRSKTSGPPIT
jgi:AcrR family transcriptional regulator